MVTDNDVKQRAVADDLIYNTGVTYAMPLFLYRISLGSSIHPEHVDCFHKASHDGLKNFWMQNGCNVDITGLMD